MGYDLVAFGNPVYDEITTPYSQAQVRILSGCSTNACLAAKKLGLQKVALIGCIGEDHKEKFITAMSKYGIELPSIKVSNETGGFRLVYDRKGNRTLDVLGVADNIFPEDVPRACLDSKIILLGPILQEIDLEFIEFLRKKSNAEIFLDPQGIIRKISETGRIIKVSNQCKAKAIIKLVDFVKPNEEESKILTGVEDPYISAKILLEWGVKICIVTLAERGSIICREKGFLNIPAYKTVAKDPTGAGDTYAGAFITRYLNGASLFESALFASAAASIKVENSGPDFPLEFEGVNARIKNMG